MPLCSRLSMSRTKSVSILLEPFAVAQFLHANLPVSCLSVHQNGVRAGSSSCFPNDCVPWSLADKIWNSYILTFFSPAVNCMLFPKSISPMVYVSSPSMLHISQDSSLAGRSAVGWGAAACLRRR